MLINNIIKLIDYFLNLVIYIFSTILNYFKFSPSHYYRVYKNYLSENEYTHKYVFNRFCNKVNNLYNSEVHSINLPLWHEQIDYLFGVYFDKYLFLFNYYLFVFLILKSIYLVVYVIRTFFFRKRKLMYLQRETTKDQPGNELLFSKNLFGDDIGKSLFLDYTLSLYLITVLYCSFWTLTSGFFIINDPYYFEVGGYSTYLSIIGSFWFLFFFILIDLHTTLVIIIRGLITLDFLRLKNDLIFY